MRAAVMRNHQLFVEEVEEPKPGPGQVLVETLACGICGSDLHFLKHAGRPGGMGEGLFDPDLDVIMGHEFSARVVELGGDVSTLEIGDVVVSIPVLATADGMGSIGLSDQYPGAYAEKMLLTAMICQKVPDGLDPRHAALTEPMAVGLHAVNVSTIAKGETAIVHGCGPIGLAIISALSLAGIEPIVAADFSRVRRKLGVELGAHEVVDPNDEPTVAAWRRVAPNQRPVIFEAVGVPGMIDQAMKEAPPAGRVIVAGVCMEPDTITPIVGIFNQLTIQFVLGYTPEEFNATLASIAAGDIDVAKLITAEVGLDEVPQAFEMLAKPDEQVKVIVTPNARSRGERPASAS